MKRLLYLGLAFGCLGAPLQAQVWRATSQAASQQTSSSPRLGQPEPLGTAPTATVDPSFTRTSYQPTIAEFRPVVRGKLDDPLRPLPPTPGQQGPPTLEVAPPPTVLQPGTTFAAPPGTQYTVPGMPFAAPGMPYAAPGTPMYVYPEQGFPAGESMVYPDGMMMQGEPWGGVYSGPGDCCGGCEGGQGDDWASCAPSCCATSCCAPCGTGECGTLKCFDPYDRCGPCRLPTFWMSAEYLNWSVTRQNLPPLVTSTNFNAAELTALSAVPGFTEGALGNAGTVLSYGGNEADGRSFNGARVTIGVSPFFGCCGLEATYFFLGERSVIFSATSNANGRPGLYRPFIDARTGTQDAEVVSSPGAVAGGVEVRMDTRLWGVEGNIRRPIGCDCNWKLDFIGGFRYVDLNESLIIRETPTSIFDNPPFLEGDRFTVTDSFLTQNNFYGGQVGLDFQYRIKRWYFGVTPKVAIGSMHQTVDISGSTVFQRGAATTTAQGGLLAQPTNIGKYSRTAFAVVPEGNLKIGYQLSDHTSLFVSYNILYLSNVVRPADQVDLTINPTQVPRFGGSAATLVGPRRPAFTFRSTDMWAWGVTMGVECKY